MRTSVFSVACRPSMGRGMTRFGNLLCQLASVINASHTLRDYFGYSALAHLIYARVGLGFPHRAPQRSDYCQG